MTIETVELQAGRIVLADAFDVEAAINLKHLVQQYKAERQDLKESLSDLAGKSFPDKEARLAAANWALNILSDAREHAAKAGNSAVAEVVMGDMEEKAGNYDKAIAHFQKAASISPSSPPCVLRPIEIMIKKGDVDAAFAQIEKMRLEFSDRPLLHYLEGLCRENQGDYEEAIECYLNATELDPNHAESLFAAGRLCDLRGMEEEAKNFYKKIGPSGESVYTNACLNLSLIYEDEGDFDNAIACTQNVLRKQPNNNRAKLFLSDAQASYTMYYSPEETKQSERLEAVLRVPVSDFELSVRSRNCLANMDINSLGDLVKKTESEMLAYKNFGETSLREIKEMLVSRGLRLGMMREDAATRAAMERARSSASQELLSKSIGEMELGVRARKCMINLGIHTIADLCDRSEAELANAKNFGRVSL
ncbi:MAG: tetratricopeptide repeat protein, partial [Planctomycetes bacterium]|nr:tetratricopeptide repeat protein [Planctomycetota bacterium]